MIRICIVDDSPLMQKILHRAATEEGDIEVVGLAGDSASARQMIKSLNPDVITLDVEMPGMSGIAFLEKVMELRPMPVIMVSSLTDAGTDIALRALEIGAVDALPKPGGDFPIEAFGARLRSALRAAAGSKLRRSAQQTSDRAEAESTEFSPDMIVIGASTGGVAALTEVLSQIPKTAPPIAITQHIPPSYAERFAARLAATLNRDIAIARDGEILCQGAVRIAPGDRHLKLSQKAGRFVTVLDDGPAVSGHIPSVDVLFESAAKLSGRLSAALLTGMGRDGAWGMGLLRAAGHRTLAQNEATCVVYGMPRAAVEAGAAQTILPLEQISSGLFTLFKDTGGSMARSKAIRSA